jgi:hypothetical protein
MRTYERCAQGRIRYEWTWSWRSILHGSFLGFRRGKLYHVVVVASTPCLEVCPHAIKAAPRRLLFHHGRILARNIFHDIVGDSIAIGWPRRCVWIARIFVVVTHEFR